MSKGGKSQKVTQTNDPYKGVQPYLLGGDVYTSLNPKDKNNQLYADTPGIFPESARLYGQGGFTPQMQNAADLYSGYLIGKARSPTTDFIDKGSLRVMQGAYDYTPQRIQNISGADSITPGTITAERVDPEKAREMQGFLDPTVALKQQLSGQVNTQYLDPLMQTVTNNINRNTLENVMPNIRSGAIQAGQYGGSRQGIAEGLAASRAQQDIASATAPIYANAFENAQNRQLSTAGSLNQQAESIATGNANRDFSAQDRNVANSLAAQIANAQNELATQQFNANLGLQNNSQGMTASSQNLNNRMRGLDILNAGNNIMGNYYGNYMNALQQPQQYNWNNLANYAGIIQPGASMGGTSQSKQPTYSNPIAGGLGGAATGAGLASMLGASTPWGAAIGGGLGLLGSLF